MVSNPAEKSLARCQVHGCEYDLTSAGTGHYYYRKRICPAHMQALVVKCAVKGGAIRSYRFCQQCGRMQPLKYFQGDKKSCQYSLDRRRSYMRSVTDGAKEPAAQNTPSSSTGTSGSSKAAPALPVVRSTNSKSGSAQHKEGSAATGGVVRRKRRLQNHRRHPYSKAAPALSNSEAPEAELGDVPEPVCPAAIDKTVPNHLHSPGDGSHSTARSSAPNAEVSTPLHSLETFARSSLPTSSGALDNGSVAMAPFSHHDWIGAQSAAAAAINAAGLLHDPSAAVEGCTEESLNTVHSAEKRHLLQIPAGTGDPTFWQQQQQQLVSGTVCAPGLSGLSLRFDQLSGPWLAPQQAPAPVISSAHPAAAAAVQLPDEDFLGQALLLFAGNQADSLTFTGATAASWPGCADTAPEAVSSGPVVGPAAKGVSAAGKGDACAVREEVCCPPQQASGGVSGLVNLLMAELADEQAEAQKESRLGKHFDQLIETELQLAIAAERGEDQQRRDMVSNKQPKSQPLLPAKQQHQQLDTADSLCGSSNSDTIFYPCSAPMSWRQVTTEQQQELPGPSAKGITGDVAQMLAEWFVAGAPAVSSAPLNNSTSPSTLSLPAVTVPGPVHTEAAAFPAGSSTVSGPGGPVSANGGSGLIKADSRMLLLQNGFALGPIQQQQQQQLGRLCHLPATDRHNHCTTQGVSANRALPQSLQLVGQQLAMCFDQFKSLLCEAGIIKGSI